MTASFALPPLRDDLRILPGAATPEGHPTWSLHDPVRNKFFSLSQVHVEMLKHWGARDILARINRDTAIRASEADLMGFLEFLQNQQLLRSEEAEDIARLGSMRDAAKQSWFMWAMHHYLFFRVPLFRPDRFLARTLDVVRPLYSATAAWVVLVILLLGLYLTGRQWDTFLSTVDYFFSLQGMVIFGLSLVITKLVHELGHAYTAKYYGLRVPTMGAAFLVLWPVAYTDTTDAWRLTSRKARMAIGSAGVIAELALAGVATLAWNFLPDGPLRSAAFFMAAVSWIMTLAVNLNPFMRWDGYYVLSDWLGVDNLQDRAFALAKWRMRKALLGWHDAPPEQFRPSLYRIMLIYAYGTWVYRAILFLGIAVLVYYLFFKLAGVFLMAVELVWFLGKPVLNELKVWHRERKRLNWNRNTLRSAFLATALVLVFVLPWSTRVEMPALYEPSHNQAVYPPLAAQLRAVHVQEGQAVQKGDLLFTLVSPDLEQAYQLYRARVDSLEKQLDRQWTDQSLREYHSVLEEKLAEARAAMLGNEAQMQRLEIRAPFAGRVMDLNPLLVPGSWLNTQHKLLRIVQGPWRVTAYLDEAQLPRVREGASGRFYPDRLDVEGLDVRLREVDPNALKQINDPYNASLYGGELAVTQQKGKELVPHEAVYRLHLDMPEASREGDPKNPLKGVVLLEGEARSLVYRAWLEASAVLIRESGF